MLYKEKNIKSTSEEGYRIDSLMAWFNGISTFVGYLMPKPFP